MKTKGELSAKQRAKALVDSINPSWHKYPKNIEAWAIRLFSEVGAYEFYYSNEDIETMFRDIVQDVRNEYGD